MREQDDCIKLDILKDNFRQNTDYLLEKDLLHFYN